MGKIISGLKYGNRKTRAYIIFAGLLLVGAIVCLVVAFMKKSPLWGMGATFFAIAVLLMTQSMKFQVTGQVSNKEKQKKDTKQGSMQKQKETKIENEEVEEENLEENNYLEKYSQSDVKKLFVTYKVNKSHRPIMIDSYQSEKIRQCPGYLWVEKGGLHLLVLEKKPKTIVVSKSVVTTIQYEKGVPAYPRMDYEAFEKPSFLSSAFRSMLPTLYEDGGSRRSMFRKNLYVIGGDLKVTNTSVHEVFDLLQAEFEVKDRVMDSHIYSTYFKSAYKINILMRDGVINIPVYKQRIKTVLESLAQASISFEEFREHMEQLVKGRLITKEYADYYMEYRTKNKK